GIEKKISARKKTRRRRRVQAPRAGADGGNSAEDGGGNGASIVAKAATHCSDTKNICPFSRLTMFSQGALQNRTNGTRFAAFLPAGCCRGHFRHYSHIRQGPPAGAGHPLGAGPEPAGAGGDRGR